MKKVVNSVLILAVAFGSMAFTTPVKKKINPAESTIKWKGEKVLGSHHGTIALKEGFLEMDGDKITGGRFVVDMTSIENNDLEGGSKGKLEGHLKSDDFFGVKSHPTATLEITSATAAKNGYDITGNITIKGITESISFNLVKNGNTATAKLAIDRTKFGIRYGSGSFFDNLGDKTISDNFELDVKLAF
ncbi:MAG: YceI family protein [Flavobacteriaceae bacterium]|nr:YceI family protein [Flavobacteriaceae bacterium]